MQGPHSSPTTITKVSVDWLPSIHTFMRTQFLKSIGHFLPMKLLCFKRTSSFVHLERWVLTSLYPIHLTSYQLVGGHATWTDPMGWTSRALLNNLSLTIWEWRGRQPRLWLEVIWAVDEGSFDSSQSCSWQCREMERNWILEDKKEPLDKGVLKLAPPVVLLGPWPNK